MTYRLQATPVICTKFLPVTHTLPRRLKAYSAGGSHVTISEWEGNTDAEAHAQAAVALMRELEWDRVYELCTASYLPANSGYTWAFTLKLKGINQ